MKAMYRIWMASAIVLLAASCSNENEVMEDINKQEIELELLHPSTRVQIPGFAEQGRFGNSKMVK